MGLNFLNPLGTEIKILNGEVLLSIGKKALRLTFNGSITLLVSRSWVGN